MRRLVGFLGILLTVVLAAAAGAQAVPDDPHDDYQRIQAQLKKTGAALDGATQRAAEAVARYQASLAALPAAEERVAAARGTVIAAGVEASSAARRADDATAAHSAAEAVYDQRTAEVAAARDRLSSFAIAIYTGSRVAEFNMLLEIRSPQEMIQRVGYLSHIAENQNAAIAYARQVRRAARGAANEAELARRTAESARQDAHDRLAQAQAAQQEAAAAQAALEALVAEQKAAAAAADAERAAVLRQYTEQKAESARIAEKLRAWDAAHRSPGPVLRPGAKLLMPVRGWKSSDFGMRYDPYYHVWQLHAGVDFAAPHGTPIYAALAGVVSFTGWAGGYGNYTCIRHGRYDGRTMSTCYGHQSAIVVGVGQRVGSGQLIGRVGSTGASTGDHLHFEVRFNGTPVDPLPYLPACLC
jgi:murein DD-endopeptidase MepM/ murein hydrolase activator NlpD